ncbi:unnamed protein product, partial [Mesorhabditis spiculigera]
MKFLLVLILVYGIYVMGQGGHWRSCKLILGINCTGHVRSCATLLPHREWQKASKWMIADGSDWDDFIKMVAEHAQEKNILLEGVPEWKPIMDKCDGDEFPKQRPSTLCCFFVSR